MIVYEYDPTWPEAFEQLKAVYADAPGELIIIKEDEWGDFFEEMLAAAVKYQKKETTWPQHICKKVKGM